MNKLSSNVTRVGYMLRTCDEKNRISTAEAEKAQDLGTNSGGPLAFILLRKMPREVEDVKDGFGELFCPLISSFSKNVGTRQRGIMM